VPHYSETFIDEGDVDIARVIEILRAADFDGVVIPDHAPQMQCGAPWHAGMAFAMGYINALVRPKNTLDPFTAHPREGGDPAAWSEPQETGSPPSRG